MVSRFYVVLGKPIVAPGNSPPQWRVVTCGWFDSLYWASRLAYHYVLIHGHWDFCLLRLSYQWGGEYYHVYPEEYMLDLSLIHI